MYVPSVNWLICMATIGLALGFGSSARIAYAYGVGVSCTMLIDTVLIIILLWGTASDLPGAGPHTLWVLVVDTAFVISNLGKVPTGGWFPIVFGLAVFGLMKTWQEGRVIVTEQIRREERQAVGFLEKLEREPPLRAAGVVVFPTSNPYGIPRTLMRNVKMNAVLHEHTIIFTLTTEGVPRVKESERVKVETLAPGLYRVVARAGFMESPAVPNILWAARQWLPCPIEDAVYFLGRDDIVVGSPRGMARWRKRLFVFLARNSEYAASSFGIPTARVVQVGGQVQI